MSQVKIRRRAMGTTTKLESRMPEVDREVARARVNAPAKPSAPYAPGYYVSAIDGPREALVEGPFATHAEALARVDAAKARWVELDGRAWFAAWGACRVHAPDAAPLSLD
jgi:hypothetical protein